MEIGGGGGAVANNTDNNHHNTHTYTRNTPHWHSNSCSNTSNHQQAHHISWNDGNTIRTTTTHRQILFHGAHEQIFFRIMWHPVKCDFVNCYITRMTLMVLVLVLETVLLMMMMMLAFLLIFLSGYDFLLEGVDVSPFFYFIKCFCNKFLVALANEKIMNSYNVQIMHIMRWCWDNIT